MEYITRNLKDFKQGLSDAEQDMKREILRAEREAKRTEQNILYRTYEKSMVEWRSRIIGLLMLLVVIGTFLSYCLFALAIS